jgi:hypothetical protein
MFYTGLLAVVWWLQRCIVSLLQTARARSTNEHQEREMVHIADRHEAVCVSEFRHERRGSPALSMKRGGVHEYDQRVADT